MTSPAPGLEDVAHRRWPEARLGVQALPPLRGATLVSGTFSGGERALQDLCNTLLAPGAWVPASNTVSLELATFLASGAERAFLIVRMTVRPRQGRAEEQQLISHAFVDDAWLALRAREIFGFPVTFAEFTFDRDRSNVSVAADVLAKDSDTVEPRELIRLKWSPSAGTNPVGSLAGYSIIQAKQIRDAIDPALSSHEDFIYGNVTLEAEPNRTQEVTINLALTDHESCAPAQELGLDKPELTFVGYRVEGVSLTFSVEKAAATPTRLSHGEPFRFRRGDPQFAPRYAFRDVEITGFKVRVNASLLQQLCDESLNAPFPERRYSYAPAQVDLVIECIDYGAMVALSPPPWAKRGITRQRELAFRMLVGRRDEGSSVLDQPAVFCPFLFVDSAWSLVSGREIIGYPKVLAKFRPSPVKGPPEVCAIDAAPGPLVPPVRVVTFDCRAERDEDIQDVLDREEANGSASAARDDIPITPIDYAWWGLDDLQGTTDLDVFGRPWLQGTEYGYGAVQLKRSPDPRAPHSYNYHEVLEGAYTVSNLAVHLPPHRATLIFGGNDDFGLMTAFGFGRSVIVPPGSWYRAKCDFQLTVPDPLD